MKTTDEQSSNLIRSLSDEIAACRTALRGIRSLIGNVDHGKGHGANAAKMRGDLLNSIRDICNEALEP